MLRHVVRAVPVLLCLPAALAAQVIPLKTVPIPSGEQFLIYPSSTLGMAGVSVAVDDPQGDAFWNPARGARLEGARVHALPTFYGETNDALGGRSLPIAFTMGNGRQFGTALIGVQQLDEFRGRFLPGPVASDNNFGDNTINTYVQAGLGVSWPDGSTSVGVSGMYANLNALDGVSQLYFRAAQLEQDGRMAEIRLGLMRQLGPGTLDAVALLRDLDMTHRQTIADFAVTDSTTWEGEWTVWQETGHDRTTTRSGLLRYTVPMTRAGSMMGIQLGGSFKSHPQIPEYDLNFPRDPGTSRAFSIGAGFTEQHGRARLSMEALFEPAWSHTWAVADSIFVQPDDNVIVPGEKTVDNRFTFANWSIAGGFDYEREGVDFQLGLRVRAIQYDLEQQNFRTLTTRNTEEGWLEWSPSWGLLWNLDDIELRYTGRWISKGNPSTGCGFFFFGGCVAVDDSPTSPGGGDIDYLVAPEGAVMMPDYRVTTHRFSVSLPIGGN